MKLLRNILVHREFITSKTDARAGEAFQILDSTLFTPEFVVRAAKLLISQYLVLNVDDFETWDGSAEDFVQEEETDAWEYNIRGCGAKVLSSLVSKSSAVLCPFLIETLQGLTADVDILFREAVYCAIGTNAVELAEYLDFDSWISTVLVLEVQNKGVENKIIRRRISLLISDWVTVKSSKDARQILYSILQELLSPEEDLVVRLTAIISLRHTLDDFDFEQESFNPFLKQFVDLFMQLLRDVDEFDSKMKIIDSLIVLIERMDGQGSNIILPSISPLLEILPQLWSRSEDQNLFRCSLVSIISKLVKTLRSESHQLNSIVYPILAEGLDTTHPGHIHLLDESLELWLATLQNCTSEVTLVHLFPVALKMLDLSSTNLKKVFHILQAYIVLSPLPILQKHANPFIASLVVMIGTLTINASNSLLKLTDISLQSCNSANCLPALFQVMYAEGLFNKLLYVILGEDEVDSIVVGFLVLLSRMIMYDPNSIVQIMHSIGSDVLERLLAVYIQRYDSLGHIKQRKMSALALASLLGTGQPAVVQRIFEISKILTSTVLELSKLKRTEAQMFQFDTREVDEDESSNDYTRRKALLESDLLYTQNSLQSLMKFKASEFETAVGSSIVQLLSQIESDSSEQLKTILEK